MFLLSFWKIVHIEFLFETVLRTSGIENPKKIYVRKIISLYKDLLRMMIKWFILRALVFHLNCIRNVLLTAELVIPSPIYFIRKIHEIWWKSNNFTRWNNVFSKKLLENLSIILYDTLLIRYKRRCLKKSVRIDTHVILVPLLLVFRPIIDFQRQKTHDKRKATRARGRDNKGGE